MIFLRAKVQDICGQHPLAYALRSGPFRTNQACKGKMAYYLREDGRFSEPDYNFFLKTQLLANKLLCGMEGYIFYVQIFVEGLRYFTWKEIIDLAYWKDEKDIEFLSCKILGSQLSLQEFSFFARNLNAISQNTNLTPERVRDGVTGIFADYYAIRANDLPKEMLCKRSGEQIKKDADFSLISDDTHGVWTILHTEKCSKNMLIENLGEFCGTYSARLNIYD